MKNITKIIIIIMITIYGCLENNKVEVIPDYDTIYLPVSKVDTPVKLLGDEEEHIEKILNIISKNYKPVKYAYYFFNSILYINDKGKVEKIRYSKVEPENKIPDAEVNQRTESLFEKLSEFLPTLEFTPAILNGEEVKSQFEWEGSFKVDENGDAEVYLGALEMKGLANHNKINPKEYFDKVEEMPFPIGGIKAIQKNIVYPETAKNVGIQGRVFVEAFIDEEGNVTRSEIIKGIGGGCDQAALAAVNKVKFTPGIKDGKPVKVRVSIPIMFKLN